jgi:Meckel syndrome type 1 protein
MRTQCGVCGAVMTMVAAASGAREDARFDCPRCGTRHELGPEGVRPLASAAVVELRAMRARGRDEAWARALAAPSAPRLATLEQPFELEALERRVRGGPARCVAAFAAADGAPSTLARAVDDGEPDDAPRVDPARRRAWARLLAGALLVAAAGVTARGVLGQPRGTSPERASLAGAAGDLAAASSPRTVARVAAGERGGVERGIASPEPSAPNVPAGDTAAPSPPARLGAVTGAPPLGATTGSAAAPKTPGDDGDPYAEAPPAAPPEGEPAPPRSATAEAPSLAQAIAAAAAPSASPATAATPARAGADEATGRFDRAAALGVLRRLSAAASRCRLGDGEPDRSGVTVTFSLSGAASAVAVDAGVGPSSAACVAAIYRTAHVPPFAGAPVRVHHAFLLR